LVNPKIGLENEHQLLIQKGGFIVSLLNSILPDVIGAILDNNN
jgi:hypothetical protein